MAVASVQVIFLAIKITGESEGEKIFSSALIEVQGRLGPVEISRSTEVAEFARDSVRLESSGNI